LATAGVVGGAGAVAVAVPFVASFTPSERAKAAGAPVEVDLSGIAPGTMKTVEWRGKPVWVLRRGPEMLERLANDQSSLKDLNAALREASTHDALTGIPNRLLVEERCRQEDARSGRSGSTYSLAVLDVDHFKRFNDNYGHDVGDMVLKALGETLRFSLRQGDLCARWGGEEFLALLPDTTLSEAEQVVNRLVGKIRRQRIELADQELAVTASIGLAEHLPGETYEQTFRRADQALLEAKQQGRDRYHVHQAKAA
jgi:diguanylate cyclase (GGDEF)-like protein